MKNNKKRIDAEQAENLQTHELDVPESRWQSKQQVQNADAALDVKAPETSFTAKKQEKKGAVLKQDVASNVVTNGAVGGLPSEVTGRLTLSYGGNEGTILGSAAYTPSVGQSRSDTRIGKKLDAVAKKINFVASEQVEQTFDESAPLAANPDAVQGYNGTYRNVNARKQKNQGNTPAENLFQRSVDELKRDQMYFSTGQVVNTSGVSAKDTPTFTLTKNATSGVYEYPESPNYTLERGNYVNRELVVKFNAGGKLEKFYFLTDEVNCTVSGKVANKSSANATIDRNYAEMDRQLMDAKAGDEKADLWTPLARAVKEPTATVGYLRDIENITGSEVFLAYKKTAACHSYQLNRAAKDGMKVHAPMSEALLGLVLEEKSSKDTPTGDPFDYSAFKDGGNAIGVAPMIISAFDSTTKYKTKADILTMPRSFKMHLQTADNNMNPLRVKAELVQAINNREVFSTIDRDYDPLMPVCISDRASLIHCYDFNDLYAWKSLDSNGNRVWTKAPFLYSYADLRNRYIVQAAIPLLEGLAAYLEANAGAFMGVIGDSKREIFGTKEVHIPIVHSTCFFSLWSLLVLAATPFILNNRVNSLRDVLYYEKNVEYPFHQLISLKEANPMSAVNYSNSDYNMPLVPKQMMPSVRTTWIMPELFWPFNELAAEDTYMYVLPWYFNQEEFDMNKTGCSYNGFKCAMSMPSIRSGARLAYLDDLYSMSERDLRLCLDRLTLVPNFDDDSTDKYGVYKYSQNDDGIPFITMSKTHFTIGEFLNLPREEGYFLVSPYGYLSATPASAADLDGDTTIFASMEEGHLGQTSYVLKFWHGRGITAQDATGDGQSILSSVSINVNRGEAYKQDWDAYHACHAEAAADAVDYGWVPSINMLYKPGSAEGIFGRSIFAPFTDGYDTDGAEEPKTAVGYRLGSLQKAIWTRVQMIPMALSPFDVVSSYRKVGQDAVKFDPFDFLYYFGLAGFKASDYREDVYNRSNEVVNQGFTFLKDPFIAENPVFKEAQQYTESNNYSSLLKV